MSLPITAAMTRPLKPSRRTPRSRFSNGTSATTSPASRASSASRTRSARSEVLVNNAGISRDAMLQKMSHQQWSEVIRTNLDSLFNMTRPIINAMRERGFGRIINISSINGQKGQLGLTNYCAAKAGMIGFTRALALESARKGITVNAIAPGYVATDLLSGVSDEVMKAIVGQIPVGRLGEAEEVARCVVFLAADEAAWITGSTLTI